MSLTRDQNTRYARQILLPGVGGGGQESLLRARVLVIGAGGLGSPVLLYLAAAGIGNLTVADDDTVALSNLQRQILYSTADVGAAKAIRAAERLTALNPDVRIVAFPRRVALDTVTDLVAAHDVTVDCSDNFGSRFLVNDACIAAGKPLVSAAVQGFQGILGVFDPAHGGPCYRCFNPDNSSAARACEDIGILGAVAGTIGAWQALATIRLILGIGDEQRGFLTIFDGLSGETRRVRLSPDPACPACGHASSAPKA